ncbi:hypothetical protein SAMN05216522_11737 [Rosenbergiella nectarea]|uniref:Uncharacterized protein n=1 Tax=Rosenbergiella nectarea TaxID=988801 RepID=A0A1H9MQC8_9GAMM|nr:hypothetical protein [Rosenbergiella nectarea]SER25896.1 hypothetical protein SAMN05216522_11737 [Rosenbergiella nectarea]
MKITDEALNEAIEGTRKLGDIGLRLTLKELRKLRDADSIPKGYALVPIAPTEDMVIAGFESKPSVFNSSTDELERCEAMSGCEEAAHRAKLCWKAMIGAASEVKMVGK